MARTAKLKVLTDRAVKAYAASGDPGKPLHDGGGLYLRKRDAACYWYLRLTDPAEGTQQWHRMFPDDPSGYYPRKGLGEAREEAERLWRQRSEGHDPRALRKERIADARARKLEAEEAARRRVTVRDLFEHWARVELAPSVRTDGQRRGRKDGGQYIREQFERRIFGPLGDVAATDVRKADVLKLLDEVTAEGKLRTANVLLSNLKQMFRFALARELVERNPLDTLSKRDAGGKETERERTLSAEEIQLLAKALPNSKLSASSQAAVWLLLATGARIGELMSAEWDHIGFEARTWHLPTTKNGRDHTIHLSDFAVTQFTALITAEAAPVSRRSGGWVFPNSAGDGPVCVKSLGKQLADRQRSPERRLQGRSKSTQSLELPGGRWTAHDLRRTAATLMASLGVSGDVIDEALNHVIESRVRRTYIRNRRPEEQAKAFDALGARLSKLMSESKLATRG